MNSDADKHGRPVVLTLLTNARFLIQFSTRADFAPEQAALLGRSLTLYPLNSLPGKWFCLFASFIFSWFLSLEWNECVMSERTCSLALVQLTKPSQES